MPAYPRSVSTPFIDNGTTQTTATIVKPVGLATGDMMVAVVVMSRAVASITWGAPPSGWSALITQEDINPLHVMAWYKVVANAGTEPANYAFTWTGGGRVAAQIIRIDDHDGIGVVAKASASSNASDTSNPTTLVDDSLILKVHCNYNAGGVAVTNPSGYNAISNFQSGTGAASVEMAVSFKLQELQGTTGAVNWGMTGSTAWIGLTLTFQPATVNTSLNTITYSNTHNIFTRNIATVSPQGEAVDKHYIRFDKAVGYMPALSWSTVMAVPAGDAQLRATGVDHDNTTPLSVWYKSTSNTHYFYRGTTLVRSLVTDDLMAGAFASTYDPTPGIFIYHGAIIFQCERKESGTIKGVGLVVSQDAGLTFSRIQEVGGGDIPVITGDVSSGMERGHRWSLCAAFPKTEGSDLTDVFVPWADYLAKADNPQGGQVGLFRMTRGSTTGTWTVDLNRTVFERWELGASGNGTHAHTAALYPDGLISHWGDVDYRNLIYTHEFDINNYKTALLGTDTVVFGGYSDVNTVKRQAPQPVAAQPGVVFGTHFASADESGPAVPMVRWNPDLTRLEITTAADEILTTISGTTWDSPAYLSSTRMGTKYVIPPYYSPDGVTWARSAAYEFWGPNKFVKTNGSDVQVATIPTITSVRPARISDGGTNILDGTFTELQAPSAGITIQDVYFDGLQFRYTVGNAVLDPLPPATVPVSTATSLKLYTTTGLRNMGAYTVSASTLDTNTNKYFSVYGFNMSASVGATFTQQVGTTTGLSSEIGWPTSDNQDWLNFSTVISPTSNRIIAVPRWQGYLGPSSSSTYPDTSILLAFVGISPTDSLNYPIPPNTLIVQQPEKLAFCYDPVVAWTWNAIFHYDHKSGIDPTYGTNRVFCSVYEDANNYINISVLDDTNMRFACVIGGVTTNVDVEINTISWNSTFECMIICDGDNLTLYAKSDGQDTFNSNTLADEYSPIITKISNHDQTVFQDIGVIAHYFWPEVINANLVATSSLDNRAMLPEVPGISPVFYFPSLNWNNWGIFPS